MEKPKITLYGKTYTPASPKMKVWRKFLAFYDEDKTKLTVEEFLDAQVELIHNWDPEVYTGGRNFGHLAYAVDDIYAACERLQRHGVTINRPPRDGRMAFVRSPDNISIELLQAGTPLAPAEPWASMANTGSW